MDKKIIAITGGIGSGKSYALNILSSWGYPTFSCDETLKEIYNDEKVLLEVKKAFPKVFDGEILNRKVLANTVFNDNLKLEKLNAITHPHIFNKVISGAKQSDGEIAFIEVPLLFESNMEDLFDKSLVISASDELRYERIKKRNPQTYQDMIKLEHFQLNNEEKVKRADFVFISSNDVDKNLNQLTSLVNLMIKK